VNLFLENLVQSPNNFKEKLVCLTNISQKPATCQHFSSSAYSHLTKDTQVL